MADYKSEVVPVPQPRQDKQRSSEEDLMREEYDDLVNKGWIGSEFSLQQFMDNRQLRDGIIKAVEIGMMVSSVPNKESIDFSMVPLIQELVLRAQANNILGIAVRPFDLFVSEDLFSGIFFELQSRGVDMTDLGGESAVAELPPTT